MKVKTTDREGNITIHDVEVVKVNPATMWVKLPDGNVIKRHKQKHVVNDNP